jgi:hypothetical protein
VMKSRSGDLRVSACEYGEEFGVLSHVDQIHNLGGARRPLQLLFTSWLLGPLEGPSRLQSILRRFTIAGLARIGAVVPTIGFEIRSRNPPLRQRRRKEAFLLHFGGNRT